jgi:hypothetical protein
VLPGTGKRGDILYHHFCEFPHILMWLSCWQSVSQRGYRLQRKCKYIVLDAWTS